MSITTVMIISIAMCVIMIGMVFAYIKGGYSYKHTVDELLDQEPHNLDRQFQYLDLLLNDPIYA